MSERFSADPYVAGRALKNKLGITDQKELERAEADISAVKVANLEDGKRIPGKYDLEHLRKFHKYIFGDVYPWACEVRTVDISKRKSFTSVRMAPQFSQEVFGQLEKANHLKGLSREEFASGLVDAYGDINALHPFHEGNGRAQRAFLSQMSRDAGYVIDWRRLDSKAP